MKPYHDVIHKQSNLNLWLTIKPYFLWKFSHNIFITYLINMYTSKLVQPYTWQIEGSGLDTCILARYIINGAMLHENNFYYSTTPWLFLARYVCKLDQDSTLFAESYLVSCTHSHIHMCLIRKKIDFHFWISWKTATFFEFGRKLKKTNWCSIITQFYIFFRFRIYILYSCQPLTNFYLRKINTSSKQPFDLTGLSTYFLYSHDYHNENFCLLDR